MIKLLKVVKENRQLTHLNLSWNAILEKQQTLATTRENEQDGEDVELSPANKIIMECFKEFVKYNPNLIELDLSNTKLNNSAILYLCYCLKRATSLKTLHLCGNMSRPRFFTQFTPETADEKTTNQEDPIQIVIDKVKKRLNAKDKLVYFKIKQYNHQTEYI